MIRIERLSSCLSELLKNMNSGIKNLSEEKKFRRATSKDYKKLSETHNENVGLIIELHKRVKEKVEKQDG